MRGRYLNHCLFIFNWKYQAFLAFIKFVCFMIGTPRSHLHLNTAWALIQRSVSWDKHRPEDTVNWGLYASCQVVNTHRWPSPNFYNKVFWLRDVSGQSLPYHDTRLSLVPAGAKPTSCLRTTLITTIGLYVERWIHEGQTTSYEACKFINSLNKWLLSTFLAKCWSEKTLFCKKVTLYPFSR